MGKAKNNRCLPRRTAQTTECLNQWPKAIESEKYHNQALEAVGVKTRTDSKRCPTTIVMLRNPC